MTRNEALLKIDITCSECSHSQALSAGPYCLRCNKKLDQIYLGETHPAEEE